MTRQSLTERLDYQSLGKFHFRLLLVAGLGWMFDAMDVLLISFILTTLGAEWQLSPTDRSFVLSAGFVGMFVGAAAAGWLADRFGRKALFQSTLLLYSISTGLCALAPNLEVLLVLRFFVGLGLGGELPVASALVSEFSPAKRRGLMIVLLESFWAYGSVLAALIARFVLPELGWRVAFAIGSLPALYVLFMRRNMPESPRFLESQGRSDEAEEVVREVAGEKHLRKPHTDRLRVARSRGAEATSVSSATGAGVRDLWRGIFARRTLMLWLLWFGIVFSYYGVFSWLPSILRAKYPLVTTLDYALIITIAQIPGYFSAAFLVERWGRKPTLVVYLLACAVGAFFFRTAPTDAAVLFWGCVLSFFNLGAWGVVYTYTPELYPTRIRGTGAGFAAAFGRIGGIIGPFIIGPLLVLSNNNIDGIFALFAAVFLVISLVVLVLGEETRGGSLEKIAG